MKPRLKCSREMVNWLATSPFAFKPDATLAAVLEGLDRMTPEQKLGFGGNRVEAFGFDDARAELARLMAAHSGQTAVGSFFRWGQF